MRPAVDPAEAARDHVVEAHRDTVAAVIEAADAAAATLDGPADRDAVVTALADALDSGVREALIELLVGAVAATDRQLQAEPVPASPYLVVTARGPLVRATLADGRLVVLVRAFERAGDGRRYVRAGGDPAGGGEARFRRRP